MKEDYRDRNSYRDYDRNRDSGYDRNGDGKWQAEEHSHSSYYSARDGDKYNGYSGMRLVFYRDSGIWIDISLRSGPEFCTLLIEHANERFCEVSFSRIIEYSNSTTF